MRLQVESFSISHETVGDTVDLLAVTGDLDAHTFEGLDEVINKLLAEGRFRLILDMRNVGYISSAGVGVLIASIGEAEANDGKVVLLSPSEEVRAILEELGLAEMFTIARNRQEALAEF